MIAANRRTVLLQAAAATALGAAPRSKLAQAPGAEIAPLIDAERRRIVAAMARDNIEGVAITFLHDGVPLWIEGFGVTDARAGRAVATDTIFSIQSTSKNVTAVAVLIAVQRGLLDLDTPIVAYLPWFRVSSRFEPAPRSKITLRLLLSHRAGFTHEAPVGNNYDPAFPSFEAHVRSVGATWLRYPVGERYRYSNLGYDLAGYILQARCGAPFADWVRRMVFEPLGMNDSTVASDVYAHRENRARGHDADRPTIPLITPLIPSGGVWTSARDMAAWSRFHLGRGAPDGNVVLRRDLWDVMHGFALGGDYGLGVIREELRYGSERLRMLGHKGGGFGFGSVFRYCPEVGLAFAALFNRPADSAYRFGEGLVDEVLARRFGPRTPRPAATDLASIDLPPGERERYIGTWIGRNTLAKVELTDTGLNMEQDGKIAPLRFTSPTQAFVERPDGGATLYDAFPALPGEPAHLECWVGEEGLDFNDGPRDPPGPDDPRWAPWLGRYRIFQWGVVADTVSVHRRNGYLYLDDTRLVTELTPGLFFTSDGEAVDFRPTPPTWKNLRLVKDV